MSAKNVSQVAAGEDAVGQSDLLALEVDGVPVTIDRRRFSSWKMMTLVRKMASAREKEDYDGVVFCSIDVMEYVLGDQLEAVIDALGGEDETPYEAIAAWYRKLRETVEELKN